MKAPEKGRVQEFQSAPGMQDAQGLQSAPGTQDAEGLQSAPGTQDAQEFQSAPETQDALEFQAALESQDPQSMEKMQSMRLSKKRCELAKERAQKPDAMPSGSAPYGYLLSADGKNYVVDPETAPFVRMMFKWSVSGLSCQQIALRMELLGIATPGQRRLGQAPDPSKWEAHVVLKILKNPNYTGDLCLGRMHQALYKSQTRYRTSSSEWVVRQNVHEPLVTREDFQKVQRIVAANNRRKGKS